MEEKGTQNCTNQLNNHLSVSY